MNYSNVFSLLNLVELLVTRAKMKYFYHAEYDLKHNLLHTITLNLIIIYISYNCCQKYLL